MKEQTEKIPFAGAEEAVKGVIVLANGEMGEQPDFFPHLGQPVVGGDGNLHLVADALAADHGAGGPGFGKGALKKGDHFRKLPVRSGRRRRSGGGG